MEQHSLDVRGRVKYIEPTNVDVTNIGNESVIAIKQSNNMVLNNLEDYCIAVDLEVVIPDRNACGLANETGQKLTIYYSSVNGTVSFMNGTDGVLTTNFTDVNVLNPEKNTKECFGIESIDISYDSWIYPEVTIRFVDVRGSSVMSPEEYTYQNGEGEGSIYRALFTFPYPMFKLKVKGFYGKGATYYLCPEETDIELDSSSGNFIITAKFIGTMFRIYADIPMTYICAAPYIPGGDEYWESKVAGGVFAFHNKTGTVTPMCKFPELRVKIANAIYNGERISAAAKGERFHNDYKNQIAQLSAIRDTCPIKNWVEEEGNWYVVSISDRKKDLVNEISAFMTSVREYDKAYGTIGTCENMFSDLIPYEKDDKEIKDLSFNVNGTGTAIVAGLPEHAKDKVLTEAKNAKGVKVIHVYVMSIPSSSKKASDYMRFGINDAIRKLEEASLKIEKEYKELSDSIMEQALGFTPSIKNIFDLAFAHMDTFVHCFYEHMKEINTKIVGGTPQRTLKYYEDNGVDTDLKTGEKVIPPYTGFYRRALDNDRQELVWPGELAGGEQLDEVNFVNALINAVKMYTEDDKKGTAEINALKAAASGDTSPRGAGFGGTERLAGAPSITIDKFIPMTPYDFVNKDKVDNPYAYISSLNCNYEYLRASILGTFALRALYYLSVNDDKRAEAKSFGKIEAINFERGVGDSIADETGRFFKFISEYSDGKRENRDRNDILNILLNESPAWNFGGKRLLKKIGDNIEFALSTNSTSTESFFPAGQTSFPQIQKDYASGIGELCVNSNYFPQSCNKNCTQTFYYFDSRDYISEINKSTKEFFDGTSENAEKAYNVNSSALKNYQNNLDSIFDKDDASFDKKVIYKVGGDAVNGWKEIAPIIKSDAATIETVYVKYPTQVEGKNINSLFDETIYKIQSDAVSKAYLFLMAMPINHRKGKFQECGIPKENENGVELKAVLLREGALYWRKNLMETGTDPIKTKDLTGKELFKAPENDEAFINKKGNFTTKNYTKWRRPAGGTAHRERELEKLFVKWANDEFIPNMSRLENKTFYNGGAYGNGIDNSKCTSGATIEDRSEADKLKTFLNKAFLSVGTIIDYYSSRNVWEETFSVPKDTLLNAISGFLDGLEGIYKKDVKDGLEKIQFDVNVKRVEDPFKNKDINLSTYLTLKTLYDKWLCAPYKGEHTWTLGDSNSDFNTFKYIDSFYHDIGKKLLVNVTKVSEWISNCLPTQNVEVREGEIGYMGKSLYEFLADVAQSTGGMLMAFPQEIGGLSAEHMANMFKAIPFNGGWDTDSSSFVFIYTYRPSEHLGNDQFSDDGFDLTSEQVLEIVGKEGYDIPAFGVSYAKQNQAFFKNITLSTKSANVTDAALAATLNIASKAAEGARETSLFGQDLYRVKTSYSYECSFDMMGCVQVMPLMYFQLNNVPFWRGAYIIYNVTHNIVAGEMTTHVTGVRVNKNSIPIVDDSLITNDSDRTYSTLGSPNDELIGPPAPNTIVLGMGQVNINGDPNKKVLGTSTVNEGNVTQDKPVICLTPAHSPYAGKTAEWAWSHLLIEKYIIPRLRELKFYDGTSYANNIQMCNVNGTNTSKGGGYSGKQVRSIIDHYGSSKVISIVPHWNGSRGQYFAAFDGKQEGVGQKRINCRADSQVFSKIFREEAQKVVDKANEGIINKYPKGMLKMVNTWFHLLTTKEEFGPNDASDWACGLNCACVLTENWFADYVVGDGRWSSSKDTLPEFETDEEGRYKSGQGWLYSDEGLNTIANMHVEAIRRYIETLHK